MMTKSDLAIRIAKILLPIALLAAGAFGMMTLIESVKKAEPKQLKREFPLIEVMQVQATTTRLMVPSRGIVRPRVQSILTSRVRGEILQVSPFLARGAFFKKGQLLLEVDDKDYRSALALRKADLARAELAFQIEVKEAAISKKEWERLMKGKPDPLVLREPQLVEARANVSAAEAALEQAELDLTRTNILAPYDGQVDERLVDLGRFLNVGTSLARIHGIDAAEIRLPLLDSELAFLDLPDNLLATGGIFDGPDVLFHADFLGKPQVWHGRIRRMEGEIDANTQMVYLVARVDDPYNQRGDSKRRTLPMGLYVRAEIQGQQHESAIIIPRKALQREGEVFVLMTQGERLELHRRKIKVLRKQGEEVVLRSGLTVGDRVCLTPIGSFVDGMQVRIQLELGAKR